MIETFIIVGVSSLIGLLLGLAVRGRCVCPVNCILVESVKPGVHEDGRHYWVKLVESDRTRTVRLTCTAVSLAEQVAGRNLAENPFEPVEQ